jgi:hypothetical protein
VERTLVKLFYLIDEGIEAPKEEESFPQCCDWFLSSKVRLIHLPVHDSKAHQRKRKLFSSPSLPPINESSSNKMACSLEISSVSLSYRSSWTSWKFLS